MHSANYSNNLAALSIYLLVMNLSNSPIINGPIEAIISTISYSYEHDINIYGMHWANFYYILVECLYAINSVTNCMHLGTYGINDLPQYSTKAASVFAPSIFYSNADVFNDKLLIPINLRSNLTLATF